MIPIPIVGDRALIFDIEHLKELRELGIIGVLSGTLPIASQQNVFLGLPLQLLREEVIWLLREGKAFLVPSERFYKTLRASLTEQNYAEAQQSRDQKFNRQKEKKEEELNAKFMKMGITRKQHRGSSTAMSYFYEIPNTSKEAFQSYKQFQEYYNKPQIQEKALQEFMDLTQHKAKDELNYALYASLKNENYYIAPGLRFGGKYIVYPGDPLRYHSHFVVNSRSYANEDINLQEVVNGGRLATAVKKIWVIGGIKKKDDDEQDETKFFSIEWSGFG